MLNKQQQAAIGFAYIIENLQTCSPFGEELARHTHAYPCEENARLCRELENVRLLAETIRAMPQGRHCPPPNVRSCSLKMFAVRSREAEK